MSHLGWLGRGSEWGRGEKSGEARVTGEGEVGKEWGGKVRREIEVMGIGEEEEEERIKGK